MTRTQHRKRASTPDPPRAPSDPPRAPSDPPHAPSDPPRAPSQSTPFPFLDFPRLDGGPNDHGEIRRFLAEAGRLEPERRRNMPVDPHVSHPRTSLLSTAVILGFLGAAAAVEVHGCASDLMPPAAGHTSPVVYSYRRRRSLTPLLHPRRGSSPGMSRTR